MKRFSLLGDHFNGNYKCPIIYSRSCGVDFYKVVNTVEEINANNYLYYFSFNNSLKSLIFELQDFMNETQIRRQFNKMTIFLCAVHNLTATFSFLFYDLEITKPLTHFVSMNFWFLL